MQERATRNRVPAIRTPIVMKRRFEGFAGIANGGYIAGLLHRALGGPIEVTLRRPTPVEAPLWLERRSDDGVELSDEHGMLASGVRFDAAIDPPDPVDFDRAVAARESYRGISDMPVEGCFVCGVGRSPADALRLMSGELEPGRVAAAWVPGPALGDERGVVHEAYAIAALDCPGGWAIASMDARFRAPMLLGRIALRYVRPVRVGLPHVVVGLATGHQRRKRFASTAIYDADRRLCAVARSTWVQDA
jgi:acyl-coenzyme A thioesterase PaaI-like protein